MRKIFTFGLLGILSGSALAYAFVVGNVSSSPDFDSVEVGYTELSPKGEEGGRAIPASASSYSQSYYQGYYQSYYQGYYQSYYQATYYNQAYYQSYYQGSYYPAEGNYQNYYNAYTQGYYQGYYQSGYYSQSYYQASYGYTQGYYQGYYQGSYPPYSQGAYSPPIAPVISGVGQCVANSPRVRLTASNIGWGTHIEFYRCTGGSCTPTTIVASVLQSSLPWFNNNVSSGSTYRYRAREYYLFPLTGTKIYRPYSNTIAVTAPAGCAPPLAPSVDLEVWRESQPGTWSGSSITDLGFSEEIRLRWDSTNTISCNGVAFSTGAGSPVDGQQNTVTEPAPGATTNYRVVCTNGSQNVSDSLNVTRISSGGDPPTITATPNPVDSGDPSDVTWNVGENIPAQCTLTADKAGTGLPASYTSSLPSNGRTDTVTITETTTYTITCPNGSADVTIRAIPQIFEA